MKKSKTKVFALALSLFALAAVCSIPLFARDVSDECYSDEECPEGMFCIDGICCDNDGEPGGPWQMCRCGAGYKDPERWYLKCKDEICDYRYDFGGTLNVTTCRGCDD